ncbi:MAG: Fe-S cluster assembly protein HesB [Acidobacteria bacterium]|nr:Fe-S cluster assembly protein HesB [Acidobacteriota bacterium]
MEIRVPVSPAFNFKRTAASHGWCELAPFTIDESWTIIGRVVSLGAGRDPVAVSVTGGPGALLVKAPGRLGKRDAERVARDVRHMFRLDDDLESFYDSLAAAPGFEWVARSGAGRLLRSPTVYEDLVKSLATTNCSWSLTKLMCARLVEGLGRPARGGGHAFPTPAEMAAAPLGFYRDEMRSGYRAPYFKELAGRVAAGELDVESWLASDLPTPELRREMKKVKGVGDYAAENLLKLVGRYDVLALDSWVRSTFARKHNRGRACKDEKIARHYARFRRWRGLALWCDMTQDWIEDK